MNDIKTYCIDSRRTAITSMYDVKNPNTIKMIDDYFAKLEDFAKDCKDVADFEAKLASSPLAQEYTDLFTKIMRTESTVDGEAPYTIKDQISDDVKSSIKRSARREAYREARKIPGIGKALDLKDDIDFISSYRNDR